MTGEEILQLPMEANDADASTVKEYLIALLRAVWLETEGFSGKRPFGNSSWEYELYDVLIRHELVAGTLDEDGYIEAFSSDDERIKADKLILSAIGAL